MLLINARGVSGIGAGYSLLIVKHYRINSKKKAKDYRFVFRLIDLEIDM